MLTSTLRSFARLFLLPICAVLIGGFCPAQAMAQQSQMEQMLPSIRQQGDSALLLTYLTSIATQQMQAGRTDDASKSINEAISIARQLGTANAIETPVMIGLQIMNKLDEDAGNQFIMDLLEENSSNPEVEMVILKQLGQALLQSGDLVRSIQLLHDYHARVAKTHPGSALEAKSLEQYGQVCMMGNMFDLGMPALKKARQLALNNGDTALASICSGRVGDTCMKTGEYETAKNIFTSQLDEATKNNDTSIAMIARNSLAFALMQLEDYDAVQSLIDQSVPKVEGYEKGYLQGISALLAADAGDFEKAIKITKTAMNSKLQSLPFLLRFQYGGSMTMSDEVTIAHYYLMSGEPDKATKAAAKAERTYKATLKQIENVAKTGAMAGGETKAGFSTIGSSISSVRQQALIAKGDVEAALVESERGRGQIQAAAMRKNFKVDQQAAPEELTIEAIRDVAKQTGATLIQYAVAHPVDAVPRALLPLSSNLRNPHKLLIWVVTPDGEVTNEIVDLDGDQNIAQMVNDFRSAILPSKKAGDETDPTRIGQAKQEQAKSFTQTSRKLHQLLVEPISSRLPKDPEELVVVMPQAELFAIPFAALMDDRGNHLIDKHTLVTSPSIETFRLAAARSKPATKLTKDQLLVVGNPSMPAYLARPDEAPTELNDLPGSEIEAKAIADLFGIQPIIGEAATEVAVSERMKNARVIHLATHGLLESADVFSRSYLSAIALAPSPEEDGFLTVREVTRMKLNADLVVLSACDTGRGEITGEGITGLSQAYMMAGVPTTVVSLWPVSDKATAVMMVNFYKALGEGKSTAAALRKATLINRDQFESPRLWAPFTVYGLGR
jgi:CHAT domain-containing protein